jgi:hypothetical protein
MRSHEARETNEKESQSKAAFYEEAAEEIFIPWSYSALSCDQGEAFLTQPWGNGTRTFRIGYDRKTDGLDCIWRVDETGKYDQTIDQEYLNKFFDIQFVAKERSLYGRGCPQFPPIK